MAIPAPLRASLNANGVGAGTPGWTIVDQAQLLPPVPGAPPGTLIGDTPDAAMRKLMRAFYTVGRTRWRWTTTSPPAAANGGLVKGNANGCACSMFNDNLRYLAETCCGIGGIARQDLNEHFLTVPGGVCIDGQWAGNVRTSRAGYDQFKCFKFSTHYWLRLGGTSYDVCFNNTFASQEQIIFTRLALDPAVAGRYGIPSAKLRRLVKPLPNATHMIEVQAGGAGPNGWPGFQLVSEAELKALA